MIVYHVAVTTAADDAARREPYRRAHLERLERLRAGGVVIGGGPAPDGRGADLFYRVAQPADLEPVVEQDPYRQGGVWTAWTARSFAGFVEPWQAPPLVLDGSRRVTIVEGPVADPAMAELALVELRGAGRVAWGGFFADGESLAVSLTPEVAEALAWVGQTGFWVADRLRARPLLWVV